MAARAVGAALISLAAAYTLRRVADPAVAPARDTGAPARTLAWILTALVFGATLAGYIAFATFLINKAMFVAGVVSLRLYRRHPRPGRRRERAARGRADRARADRDRSDCGATRWNRSSC